MMGCKALLIAGAVLVLLALDGCAADGSTNDTTPAPLAGTSFWGCCAPMGYCGPQGPPGRPGTNINQARRRVRTITAENAKLAICPKDTISVGGGCDCGSAKVLADYPDPLCTNVDCTYAWTCSCSTSGGGDGGPAKTAYVLCL